MQEGGGDLAAHALAEAEGPHRLVLEGFQLEQAGEACDVAPVVVFADLVDGAQELERVGGRQLVEEVGAMAEQDADVLCVLDALAVRIAP